MSDSSSQPLKRKREDQRGKSPAPQQETGKLPPQATDLEEAVLGALMIEKSAVNEVIDILKPESFYKETNQRVFGAIQELFQRSEPIDILTVTAELRNRGELDLVGGAYYISLLTNKVASSANIEFHARIISQKYILRELIRISSSTIKDAYEETTDVFDLLDRSERDLFTVAQGNIRKEYDTMSQVIKEALENIEAARENVDGISGVPTGFNAIDRVTAGFQRSDMVVLAARPGMGKTAFVLSMARNIAVDFKRPLAVFSLEMSSVQLTNRLISSETGIPSEKLRKGNLEEHEFVQLHERIKKLADAPIYIDDTPALSIFELRAKARRLKQKHQIDMIIIDYMQLMTAGGDKGNREQEISTISRSVKTIAKELNVPIIALSQLSRSVETRGGDKRPLLSDLRESGAIEQDADLVSFIYRPEYYGFTEDADGNPTTGMAEFIIAKHRNGALENVKLRFIGKLAKFDNLDGMDEEPEPGQSNLSPNTEFENMTTITRQSRMNNDDDDDDDDFAQGDFSDAPF